MEKKSIFTSFRRESKEKKHRSNELREDEPARKSLPGEERMIDPIRRVTPAAPPPSRRSKDGPPRVRDLPDPLNPSLRASPSGPRILPKDTNGERAPYEPKYFSRSNSIASLNSSSPPKPESNSIQGARSMSQAGHRDDRARGPNNNGRNVAATKSFEYPPRRDSMIAPLRRGQSTADEDTIINMRLSQAYDIKQGGIRALAIHEKSDVRASSHGVIDEATPRLGRVPTTPRQPRQRSKLHRETSADDQEIMDSHNGNSTGIARWLSYSAQDSPKLPTTPGRSFSTGEEMQEWLEQNSSALKRFGSPERPRPRSKYDHLSPRLKGEAEAFKKFKAASHRRKLSIEAIRKAQEAMIMYPNKAGSPRRRATSTSNTHNIYASMSKVSTGKGTYGNDSSPLARKPLPELKLPPEEIPSPFLRPEEKGCLNRSLSSRAPPQYLPIEYVSQAQAKEFQGSPSATPKQVGRSRIPTPSKAIKRKTLKGPTASDLAKLRAAEYGRLAAGNPFESGSVESTPKLGLPRSFPELNIAIRAIATPTYEEIDSEPFKFPHLVPKPLNVRKKGSKEATIRTVLSRKPTLRTSKTQGPRPSSISSRNYRNLGNRTKSDDFETLKDRHNQADSMKRMHDEIDDYLDILLKERIECKLAEGEFDRHLERSASRATAKHSFSKYEDVAGDHLQRASVAAEKNRWEELSVEEAQSGSPGLEGKEEEAVTNVGPNTISDEEAAREKEAIMAAKVKNRWAEMRAKLRVESTYSDLSVLARSPDPRSA